jgi:acyl-CoA synthetase (AMP-forming)/AMP-acid ligase II
VWRLVETEGANSLMITGDAMGRPLIEALDDSPSKERDLSSMLSLSSTAAVFSPSVKDQFLERFPDLVMTDAIGSSEGGANGIVVVEKGKTAMQGGPTVTPVSGTAVLGDDLRPVEPGSGVIGRVARSGHIPLGYYKDPEKTAETKTPDGWVRTGDAGFFDPKTGHLKIIDRAKDVGRLKDGTLFAPKYIENKLKFSPFVAEAVIIGY